MGTGEKGASDRLDKFIENGICNYKVGRNRDQEFVSRLSPHIHFGEISPHQIWHQINKINETEINGKSIDHFLSELGGVNSHTTYFFTGRNYSKIYREKFDQFTWSSDEIKLRPGKKEKLAIQ